MVIFIYFLIILFSILVISSFNPVFSVVWLVMSFIGGAILLWCLSCDFLALLVTIVYVGAIAVLFLFVIMMLPTSLNPDSTVTTGLIPIISFSFLLMLVSNDLNQPALSFSLSWQTNPLACIDSLSFWLYGEGIWWVMLAGLILLVALIGSLILCLTPISSSVESKNQDVFSQITR